MTRHAAIKLCKSTFASNGTIHGREATAVFKALKIPVAELRNYLGGREEEIVAMLKDGSFGRDACTWHACRWVLKMVGEFDDKPRV